MKKLLLFGIIIVALFAGVGTAAASVNLVGNGGFENPTTVSPSFDTFGPGNALAPWTIDAGTIDLIKNYWVPAEALQSIDMAGTPGKATISQDILTDPTKTYDLSFAMAGNPKCDAKIKMLEIYWNSNLLSPTESFDTSGTSTNSMGWETKTRMNLVPSSSGTTELKFIDVTPDAVYCGVALDNVIVTEHQTIPTPTPEFPTLALPLGMLIGIIGVVYVIKGREK